MNKPAKYEAYNAGRAARDVAPQRHWVVIENDGSEDGRSVGENMTERDAVSVAALLNAAAAYTTR